MLPKTETNLNPHKAPKIVIKIEPPLILALTPPNLTLLLTQRKSITFTKEFVIARENANGWEISEWAVGRKN